MCFSTKKLTFLDIVNYLAPGFSYDMYLKAYGCELQKGHFPYEYMDGIVKLEDRALPPNETFYSRFKTVDISDDYYARCQAVWRDNLRKSMRDCLMWYNNCDIVSFLEAIDIQFAFYKQQNIDMFKDGVRVPGLTLIYLFNELPSNTFTVFNHADEQRSAPTRQRQYRRWSGRVIFSLSMLRAWAVLNCLIWCVIVND